MEIYDFVEEFESEIYCKNGDIIWISESVRQVKNDKQELLYFEGTVRDVTEKRQIEDELRKQRRMSEELLLNILPQYIAEKLKRNRHTIADYLPEVTVLFADLVGFTELSAKINPTELVTLLNEIFSEFDQLTND
jgi:class 3 adenylate cyclase